MAMKFCASIFILILIGFQMYCTDQKYYLPRSVSQEHSTNTDECLESFLYHSRPRRVRLVCGSGTMYCPSSIVNKITAMLWMYFDNKVPFAAADGRNLWVMAGDNVSHLLDYFSSNHSCFNERIVDAFPRESSVIPVLEKIFTAAWKAGTADIVVVVSDSLCRVFTSNPINEQSSSSCPAVTPVLVSSWAQGFSPINDSNLTYFPEKRISNLHLCPVRVVVLRVSKLYWTPVLDFLEVAMNATFNITLLSKIPSILIKLRPSEIQVTPMIVHEIMSVKCFIPLFLFYSDNIFAVPRVPLKS